MDDEREQDGADGVAPADTGPPKAGTHRTGTAPVHLADLRDDPFRLLLEMERRAREARIGAAGEAGADREWTGIALRVGDLRLLTPRDDVLEVMLPPAVTRVPGAQPWLRGIMQHRGQVIPVTDLRAFLLDLPTAPLAGARLLTVSHRNLRAALVVDEVYGFRRLPEGQRRTADIDALPATVRPCVTSGFWLEDRVWPVMRLRPLVESERFLDPAV